MIKLVQVFDRRADVAVPEFYEHWLSSYGALVASHAATLGARKYVQSHLIDTPANEALREPRGMLGPVAGISETWFDSVADFRAATTSPAGVTAMHELAAAEEAFVDVANTQIFLTAEHTIFDHTGRRPLGPEAVKCAYLLTKRDDLTQQACHATWLDDHGPLVASFAELLHTAKYVQSHTIAPEINQQFVDDRKCAEPLDGITEVWLQSISEREGGTSDARRQAGTAMAEDERRFVQMDRSRCFMTTEHVVFDHL